MRRPCRPNTIVVGHHVAEGAAVRSRYVRVIKRWDRDEGQGLVQYVTILGLFVVIAVLAFIVFGGQNQQILNTVSPPI